MGELNPQVTYKPVHKNPMDKNRSPTDTPFLYIFVAALSAWFIMNCIYLFRGNTTVTSEDTFFLNITGAGNQAIITLPKIFNECGVGIIIWIAISGIIVFLIFLKTLHCLPKFWAFIGVLIMAVFIVGLTLNNFFMVYALPYLQKEHPELVPAVVFNVIKIFIQIMFLVTCMHAVCKVVKIDGLAKLIKKTSHATFFFPTVFLFGLIITILCLTVVAFTTVSLYSMDNSPSGTFSLFGGMYLIQVICTFAALVISQCVSTWYWSQNKEELSGSIILQSIGLIGRNHVGTIVFISSLILPIFLSIYVLCTNKFQPPPNSGFRAFLTKWTLIVFSPAYALTLTASHGLSIHEATKKVYSLFTRNCALVLSFISVFEAILFLFLAIALLISMGTALAIFQNFLFNNVDYASSVHIYYSLGVLLFASVYITVSVAGNTVLVNTTEEIEETDEEQEINQIQGNV